MDHRTARFAQEHVGRLLWRFSLPGIAGMVFGSIYTIIDRLFLGNVVGTDAIAGISIGMPIGFLMLAFGMLFGVGSGAMVSIRLGQGKKDEAEVVLGNTVIAVLITSAVLTAAFLVALDPLLVAFGAGPKTLPYAQQFMRVILLGSVFQYTIFGLNGVIRSEGNPRLAMMTMFINAGLNIVLDVLFIYGLRLGVAGAATATVISQGVAATWTVLHFCSRRSVLKLRVRNLRPHWHTLRPVIAIGMAPFVMHLAASAVSLIMNRGLARYGGDTAIGAAGVINAFALFVLMPVFGLSQGAQPIIGYNYGARRFDRVRQTLKLAVIAATLVTSAGFAVAELIPDLVMGAFAPDKDLVTIGARGMRLCLLMFPVVGFGVIGAGFFQATGKAKTALVLTLLRQVLVLIPMLFILPPFLGLDGMWGAGPISDFTSSLLSAAALTRALRELPSRAEDPTGGAAETLGAAGA